MGAYCVPKAGPGGPSDQFINVLTQNQGGHGTPPPPLYPPLDVNIIMIIWTTSKAYIYIYMLCVLQATGHKILSRRSFDTFIQSHCLWQNILQERKVDAHNLLLLFFVVSFTAITHLRLNKYTTWFAVGCNNTSLPKQHWRFSSLATANEVAILMSDYNQWCLCKYLCVS